MSTGDKKFSRQEKLPSTVACYPREAVAKTVERPFDLESAAFSYPKRGPHGNSGYPGNVTGFLIRDMLKTFGSKFVVDPAQGGGTVGDVCKELKISFRGFDLKTGFDLTSMSLREQIVESLPDDKKERRPDLIFFHAPYWEMLQYSGNAWGEPHPADMSRIWDLELFLERTLLSMYNIYEATAPGGYFVLLMGDRRKNGRFYSLQSRVVEAFYDFTQYHVIKLQHNCNSDGKTYKGLQIPLAHEHLLIFQKPVKAAKTTDLISGEFSRAVKTVEQAVANQAAFIAMSEVTRGGPIDDLNLTSFFEKMLVRLEPLTKWIPPAFIDKIKLARNQDVGNDD